MTRCWRARCPFPASSGRDDGLCWRHRKDLSERTRLLAARAARDPQPVLGRPLKHSLAKCERCGNERRVDYLREGVCGRCRQAARTAKKHEAQRTRAIEKERRLCSVSKCLRGRELGTTCLEHAPRFDRVKPARVLRAEDFAVRTRDPREGV